MFEQDYIIRLIRGIAQLLAKLLFKKESANIELPKEAKLTSGQQLYQKLIQMADSGMINEAENLLSTLDTKNMGNYEVILAFYNYINEYSDDYLEQCQYTREEIYQGLRDNSHKFGISVFESVEKLFDETLQ